ncbi:MAG: hypothetical protein ACMVO3_02745 [Thalassobaculum sp.]
MNILAERSDIRGALANDQIRRALRLHAKGMVSEAAQVLADSRDTSSDKTIATAILVGTRGGGGGDLAAELIKPFNYGICERFIATYFPDMHPDALVFFRSFLELDDTGWRPIQESSIFLFPFPKSGSTFLNTILGDYTGRPNWNLSPLATPNGVHFDYRLFDRAARTPAIARGHLAGHPTCLARCALFGIAPVFVHRNIFTSLLSYADHMQNTVYGLPYRPPSGAAALNAAVLRMAFHYVEMFASWTHTASLTNRVLVMSYEENRGDWIAAAERVLRHVGLPVDRDRLEDAAARSGALAKTDPRAVRFRTGGDRNHDSVDPSIKEQVRALYALFPTVDFSPIDPEA